MNCQTTKHISALEVAEGMADRKYPVFKQVPAGWKVLKGAVNHPRGYRWINNNKSRFSGDYKKALVPEEVAFEWRNNHK